MIWLIWIALPVIILGSGSFFLWSVHNLDVPTM
jgi:hypothetical protein